MDNPPILLSEILREVETNKVNQNNISGNIGSVSPLNNQSIPELDLLSLNNFQSTRSLAEETKPGDFGFDIRDYGNELNDGSFSFKDQTFKAFESPAQVDERYAQNQTGWEQFKNGIGKAVVKAGVYAIDGTIGTAYGIASAIGEGSFEALYNNDFAKSLDDFNAELDNDLPNYYTEHEKEMGFLSSLGTANFWANDFAGGLSFLAGTVLSEGALVLATGGGSAATTLGKFALRNSAKKLGKEVAEQTFKKGGKKLLNAGRVGRAVDLSSFAIRSSVYEAGMEARLSIKEATDNYINNYKLDNSGKSPSGDELLTFIGDAKSAANGVFAANMAILAPSNLLMFGKLGTKGIKETSNSFLNRKFLGLGYKPIKQEGKELVGEVIKANVIQKTIGRTSNFLAKPLTEGIWEEGLQGVATKTMMNYLDTKYDPNANLETLSVTNSFYEALSEQYGTKEGWKENLLGSMIGMVGGSFTSFTKNLKGGLGNAVSNTEALPGFGKESYSYKVAQNEKQVQAMNKRNKALFERVNNTAFMSNNIKRQEAQEQEGISYTESSTIDMNEDWAYINSMASMKSSSELKEDYSYAIDNIKVSEEYVKENNITEEQLNQFRENKKQKFNNRVDAALQAKQAIKYLNVDLGVSEANKSVVEDALAYNLYSGKESLTNAEELGTQLNELVGKDKVFESVKYFESLTSEQAKVVDEIRTLDKDIKDLQEKSMRFAKFPNLRTFNKAKNTSESFREKEIAKNIEITKLNDELLDKQSKKDKLTEQLENQKTNQSFYSAETKDLASNFSETNVLEAIEQLDNLDNYVDALEADGRVQDAAVINNVLRELKFNLASSRETNNQFKAMASSDYFKTKSLRKLISKITGPKYVMSEDVKTKIRDNNSIVDKALKSTGIESNIDNADFLEKLIQDSPELSDKNKFHLELMIRNIIQSSVSNEQLNIEVPSTKVQKEEVKKVNDIPRSGARLKDVKVDISNNPTLDYIKKTIDTIIDSSDQLGDLIYLRNPENLKTQKEIKDLQQKQEESDAKKNSLEINLETEKGLEEKDEEAIKNLEKEISELPDYTQEIEKLKSSLQEEGSDEIRPTKANYERLETLLGKSNLTEKEKLELENLSNFVEQWITLDGTVADGVSLTDLIQQKVDLEKLPENFENTTENQEPDELFESSNSVAINGSQSFTISVNKLYKDTLDITGVTFKEFVRITNPNNKTDLLSKEVEPGDTLELELNDGILPIKIGELGGIEVVKDNISLLNTTPIKIINTSKNQSTHYNVTLIEENGIIRPLQSDYASQMDGNREVNEVAIYETKEKEPLSLRINLNDSYNQKLLESIPDSETLTEEDRNAVATYNIEKNKLDNLERKEEELSLKPQSKFKTEEEALDSVETNDKVLELEQEIEVLSEKIELLESSISKENLEKSELELRELALDKLNSELEVKDKELTSLIVSLEAQVVKEFKETSDIKEKLKAIRSERTEQGRKVSSLKRVLPKNTVNNKLSSSELADLKENLKQGLVISIYTNRGEGDYVGTLKSQRNPENLSVGIENFNAFRDSIIEKYFDEIISSKGQELRLNEEVSNQSVYLGHPNYKYVREGGKITTEYIELTPNQAKDVVDVGYVENGKLQTRNEVENIDVTFTKPIKTKGKTGVVVINRFGKNIAIPVNAKNSNENYGKRLEDIYRKGTKSPEMALELNKVLLEAGVNPKKEGFIFISAKKDGNNINDKEILNKVAELSNKDYFYNVEDWAKKDSDLELIANSQVVTNIDMNRPFISPKLMLDIPTMTVPSQVNSSKVSKQSKLSQGGSSKLSSILSQKGC